MKTQISLRILAALLLAFQVAACSDDGGGGEQNNGEAQDTGLDSETLDDTGGADAGQDATDEPDAPAPDIGQDVGQDVGADAAADVGVDVSPDVSPDVGPPPVDDLDPTGGAWSDRYSMPGLQGQSGARAYAVTAAPSGGFYVGGEFTLAGRAAAENVAHWDGTKWNAVGLPPLITVHAMATHRDNLYIGGEASGGGFISGPNTVEKWDGTSWSMIASIGGGPQATVYDIEVLTSGEVLIAGNFGMVDGQMLQNLALYDGTTWSPLSADAPNGAVRTVETLSDGRICIGGEFDSIGALSANRVACWDGSAWQALGSGTDSTVHDIIEGPQGEIIIGGSFSFPDAGGNPIVGLASWSGDQWSPVAGGVRLGSVTSVRSLAYGPGGALYVGGTFVAAGPSGSTIQASNIAKLDNGTWEMLGDGVVNEVGFVGGGVVGVNEMLVDSASQKVVVAGLFSNAGGQFGLNIAHWDTSQTGNAGWAPVIDPTHEFAGADAPVTSMAKSADGEIYIAGGFNAIGGQSASQIVKYDGSSWYPLGAGLEGTGIYDVEVLSTGEVIAGGEFSVVSSGGNINNMAMWNGSAWSAFGSAIPGVVRDLAVDANDTVYAVTEFENGGNPLYNVYKLDGTTWQQLGAGFDGIASTLAIGPNGDVFVGGLFDADTAGNPLVGIARWDGSAWVGVGGGINANGRIEDMTVYDGKLLVVGQFSEIGGQNAGSVALWDGSAWDTLGGGLPPRYPSSPPPTVLAVVAKANGFFLTGTMSTINDTSLNSITWYDGTEWHALGDGLADLGQTLLISEHRLLVGGPFTAAAGMPSYHIAEWDYAPAP